MNLFIPSRLRWADKGLALTQTTAFPASGDVTFTLDSVDTARPLTLMLRYPEWSGRPTVRVNGRKVGVRQSPSSYIALRRKWRPGDKVEVSYPMHLALEQTPDNPARAALLYGPVVLAGDLGTEGMTAPAPFSDPTVRNDYYTYDYHIPAGLPTHISVDPKNPAGALERTGALEFRTPGGVTVRPLFDTHRTRYVVYWDIDSPQ